MYNSTLCFLVLLFTIVLSAQETEENPLESSVTDSNWDYDGFLYPDFGTREQHSYFIIKYDLNPKLQAELNVFYDTYQVSDRVRAEFLLKKYVTDKLYIFSGLQIEAETRVLPGNRRLPPRLGVVTGLGYDISENFMLEVKGNFQINNSRMGAFGERLVPMPQVYTLGSKIRF